MRIWVGAPVCTGAGVSGGRREEPPVKVKAQTDDPSAACQLHCRVCRGGREQYLQGQRVDLHPSLLLSASPLGTTDLVSKGPSVDALALQVLARGLGGC